MSTRTHKALLGALQTVSSIACERLEDDARRATDALFEPLVHAISSEMGLGMEHPSARVGVIELIAALSDLIRARCIDYSHGSDAERVEALGDVVGLTQMVTELAELVREAS